MREVTVRQVTGDEMLKVMYWMHAYAFSPSPPLRDREAREDALRRRLGATHMAVYEDDEPVVCGASRPLIQNVRGVNLPMAGVLDVTTHPQARRRGYAKRLMVELLATVREQGAAVSALYPFRESFYQRLGYVTVPQSKRVRLNPLTLQSLLDIDLGGQVELLSIEDGYPFYREFMEAYRDQTHGLALFVHDDMAERLRGNRWLALARADGQVDGVMLYELRGEQIGRYHLKADRFYYSNPRGRYLLLEWIARHIDQAAEAEIILPSFEVPESWLADLRLEIQTAHHITPMVRVLDVAQLEGLAVGPGNVTVSLRDPICSWNEGKWSLGSDDGRLLIEPGDGPQADLTIQALTALVYGTHDPEEFVLRRWGELDAETVRTLRGMFNRQWPHLDAPL